jgi:hypothetical protein
MNYAIEILEKEIDLIERCLSEWDLSQYPESRIERNKKLTELKQSVIKLKRVT